MQAAGIFSQLFAAMSSPADAQVAEMPLAEGDAASSPPPGQPTQASQPAPSLAPVLPGALPDAAALAALQSWTLLTRAVGMPSHVGEAFLQALELEPTDPWHLVARAPADQFWEDLKTWTWTVDGVSQRPKTKSLGQAGVARQLACRLAEQQDARLASAVLADVAATMPETAKTNNKPVLASPPTPTAATASGPPGGEDKDEEEESDEEPIAPQKPTRPAPADHDDGPPGKRPSNGP